MTERRMTPEALVKMIEASPDNPMANGVSMLRSGKRLRIEGLVDIEKLTERINSWFEEASCRT